MTHGVDESSWLRRARRLHALGATGMFFSTDEFDRERYQEIADIALGMLADIGDLPLEQVVNLFAEEPGYRTPKVDVRGAVLDGDCVLLVQEKSDGLWTLPGGYADVGYSASENAAKEISEEANLQVAVTRLYALRHKAKHSYAQDLRDFYKLFFLCERLDDAQPAPGLETAGAEFFHRDKLPPLSLGRTIRKDIEQAFLAAADPGLPAYIE